MQEILQTGNMISDKTLARLARRGVSAPQGGPIREEIGTSRPGLGSGEVEMTQDGALENPPRKRNRGDGVAGIEKGVTAPDIEIVSEAVGRGLGVGARGRPPLVTPRGSGKTIVPISIEITEDEKWTSGNKPPLQAFDAFRLPQDFEPYLQSSRSELVLRSKRRVGRVRPSSLCVLTKFSFFFLNLLTFLSIFAVLV